MNYAKPLPKDKNNESLQEYPAAATSLQTVAGVPLASSVLTLTDSTTVLEVATVGNPIVMKWGSASVISAAGTANFDHMIPANSIRRFVVPVSTSGTTSVAGVNTQMGLYNKVALKVHVGSASVFTAEY